MTAVPGCPAPARSRASHSGAAAPLSLEKEIFAAAFAGSKKPYIDDVSDHIEHRVAMASRSWHDGNGVNGNGAGIARRHAARLDQKRVWPGDLTEIPDWVYTDENVISVRSSASSMGLPELRRARGRNSNAGDFIARMLVRRRWLSRAQGRPISVVRTAAFIAPPSSARVVRQLNEFVCP